MTFNFYETKTAKELGVGPSDIDVSKEYTYQEVWNLIPNFTKNDRVVVVDADALVYRVSAATDSRSILASRGGKSKEFDTRTKFKSYCQDKGLEYETFNIEDKVVAEDVSYCLGTLKRAIKNIKERLNATRVLFFLGGKYNARCDLPLPIQYKSARKDLIRPTHLNACREYLVKYHGAYVVTSIEADDVVQGLTQYIVNETEAYGIAWQLDKDFHQSLKPSRYYHPVKDEIIELKGGIGELYLENNKVKGNGLLWLLQQLLISDTSDCYAMNSHYLKRYGEKSYYKDFKDCADEKELLAKVVSKLKVLLPEQVEYWSWDGEHIKTDWLGLCETYFKCCYMVQHPEDKTTFESLLKEYEVEY